MATKKTAKQKAKKEAEKEAPNIPEHHEEREEDVTPLELFFDLVFVFTFTQVTALIAADPTWEGLGKGMLTLGVVWFAWTSYSWLTDTLDPEQGLTRIVMLGVMAGMFVVALSLESAFDQYALLFALAYLFVRIMHLVLYVIASRLEGDEKLMKVVRDLAPSMAGAPLLLVLASAFDGEIQAGLWILAICVEIGGPLLSDMSRWRVVSATHFAERYGLIVIIALGESIIATGVGAEGIELGFKALLAAVLGILISGALWWAYFDVVAIVAERRLNHLEGKEQTAMARDSYTFIHFLFVAGIILFAVGSKKTLTDIGAPLDTVPAIALCGGVAMYYLGHVIFRLRNLGTVNVQRLIAAIALLALIPLADKVDATVAMGAVTLVCAILVAYEAAHYAEFRAEIRDDA